MSEPILSAHKLNKSFGPVHVLHDVDLALAPRSRVAIVGETGSGKTTFAKLLTRLMDPASGRILVDGVDLRELSFASLRRNPSRWSKRSRRTERR